MLASEERTLSATHGATRDLIMGTENPFVTAALEAAQQILDPPLFQPASLCPS
jgi:hypothetical protein